MAVAFDAFTSTAIGTGNLSWTHVPVGTPAGIKVYVVTNSGGQGVSSVTYGGSAMAQVASSPIINSGEGGSVSCFFIGSSIPTGSQTVSVTVLGNASKFGNSISLTAASNTTVQNTNVLNNNTITDPSVTLALGNSSSFVSIGWWNGFGQVADVTPLASWTSRVEIDLGNQVAGIYTYDVIGTGNLISGLDTSGGDDCCFITVGITEIPGAAVAAVSQLESDFIFMMA